MDSEYKMNIKEKERDQYMDRENYFLELSFQWWINMIIKKKVELYSEVNI